jgi:uncharacterized protein YdhG (YjbR/CyaY superfamily)
VERAKKSVAADAATVDAYLRAQPAAVQPILAKVRRAIRSAAPGAVELISYKMPGYKLYGRPVLYFAAWKEHYAIYPATGRLTEALRHRLAPYDVSKGTIRFPWSDPVPVALIRDLARLRVQEVTQAAAARPTRRKPAKR